MSQYTFFCTLASLSAYCTVSAFTPASMATCSALRWCTNNGQNVECGHFSPSVVTVLATEQTGRNHQTIFELVKTEAREAAVVETVVTTDHTNVQYVK